MSAIFTVDELSVLKMKSLIRLADYYKVDSKGLNKPELVDALLGVFVKEEQAQAQEEMPMSVRVRRAKESQNG